VEIPFQMAANAATCRRAFKQRSTAYTIIESKTPAEAFASVWA